MFGDQDGGGSGGQPGSGRDEGSGGGDVEGARVVAAGAAGIDQAGAFGVVQGKRRGVGAEHIDEAGDLGGSFTAGGQRSEQSGDMQIGRLFGQDGMEEGRGLRAGKRLSALDDVLEGVQDGVGHTG